MNKKNIVIISIATILIIAIIMISIILSKTKQVGASKADNSNVDVLNWGENVATGNKESHLKDTKVKENIVQNTTSKNEITQNTVSGKNNTLQNNNASNTTSQNKTTNQNNTASQNTTTNKNNTTSQNTTTNSQKNNNTNQSSNSKPTGTTPYYIKVNYGAQVVTIYQKDAEGYYTKPVKAMICSTGTATPKSGVYKIPGRWNWGKLFGNVYGQYVTVITGQILFHSVPYLERNNPGSLKTAEYDKLGTPASAGCVRLTVEDALWIHTNCKNGTQVEFYTSSNPGPLGKPTAKKISNAKGDLKNWDPTDPNTANPWKNVVEED